MKRLAAALPGADPWKVFLRLSSGKPMAVFLDGWDGEWSFAAWDALSQDQGVVPRASGERGRFRPFPLAARLETLLHSLDPDDTAIDRFEVAHGFRFPFRGGVLAALGYGCRNAFEHLPDRHAPELPDWHAGLYASLLAHRTSDGALFYLGPEDGLPQVLAAAASGNGGNGHAKAAPPVRSSPGGPLECAVSAARYAAMVLRAKEYIAAGDIFQANLARNWSAPFTGDGPSLYGAIRRINPSPFAAFYRAPGFELLSNSPELLLLSDGNRIETRPIAGTAPRRGEQAFDEESRLALERSAKNRAEHLMLLDLARNDLGRVCRPGSVHVPEPFRVEGYSHVWHLVSVVRGELAAGRSALDALAALFPCGTITGAPKIRAMEIIEELEDGPRGFYTGSLGYVGFDGASAWNVLIRTLTLAGGRISLHTGAGIVADSVPAAEAEETEHKAGAWLKALTEEA